MTLTRGSFTYASGEEYHGEWKEGKALLQSVLNQAELQGRDNSHLYLLCCTSSPPDTSPKLCSIVVLQAERKRTVSH